MILLLVPFIASTAPKILYISYTLFSIFSSILREKIKRFSIFVEISQTHIFHFMQFAKCPLAPFSMPQKAPPLPHLQAFAAKQKTPPPLQFHVLYAILILSSSTVKKMTGNGWRRRWKRKNLFAFISLKTRSRTAKKPSIPAPYGRARPLRRHAFPSRKRWIAPRIT